MAQATELDAYRWLITPPAQVWLRQAAEDPRPLLSLAAHLRTRLSAEQVHLLLEQIDLRRRASEKFSAADRMFFTRKGLEQATGERVAAYKAQRFPAGAELADLCCGIGGDLFALTRRGRALGIDRDCLTALLAQANCRSLGFMDADPSAAVEMVDVERCDVGKFAAWHIDPDRRPAGRRTTRVEGHEPGPAIIARLLARNPDAAIKLAPAATVPEDWTQNAELEWLSRGGECRQLVAWFGRLAQASGGRRATIVDASASAARTVIGESGQDLPIAATIGRYLYEPDAAVLAAKLVGSLAKEFHLSAIIPGGGYLTSDQPIRDPALAAFEIREVLPFDLKKLKALLRERRIGRLEVKKRGVPHDPEKLRRQLAAQGGEAATLVVTRVDGKVIAILARRLGGAD